MTVLSAKNICKTFRSPQKVEVLSDVSLEINAGESVAICGRSGEGKTTLLHILGSLEEPDSGTIEIAGQPFTSSKAPELRNRHIGFIFQTFNLLEDFTLLENVLMPARIARQKADKKYGMELLDKVGLLERADFPVKLLSGGERQRAAIARALCNNPDLILADEPSGNLDRANALNIGTLLLDLVKVEKKSLVLVTHDPDLANLCDQEYRLSQGNLVLAAPL